jgi:hypothetical protein
MHRDQGVGILLAFVLLLPAFARAGGSVTLSWNANHEADLAGYRIYYGTSSGYYSNSLNAGNVTSFTIDNLSEGITYFFAITAFDNAGNESGYSAEVSAAIPSTDTTPPFISQVAAVKLMTTGATITWTTDEPADTQVDFGTDINYGTSTPLNSQLVTSHSAALTGLSINTTYHYRVNSRDAAGHLATSDDFTFTTLASATFARWANAGGGAYTDGAGQVWPADQEYTTGSEWGYDYGNAITQPNAIANTEDDALYQSARLGAGGYRFEVPAVGRYRVRLHFAELVFSEPGKRAFNVTIENVLVVNDLDLVAAVGANVATSYTFDTDVLDGRLAVKFVAVVGEPTISAIEVMSVEAGNTADVTPPSALTATLIDANSLRVVFNEPVGSAPAQNVANYSISPAVAITAAALQSDQRSVLLTTGAHASGQNYSLTIRNISDLAMPPNVMGLPVSINYAYQASDVTPPAVISAVAIGRNTVSVLFNEAVGSASAQNIANYTIRPAIQITGASLLSDQKTVQLATGDHASGQNYALTVRNVSDLASTPNVMTAPATINYVYQAEDTTPPRLISVTIDSPTHLVVLFSEQVTAASAQTVGNYRITDGVTVNGAQIAANGIQVELTTSAHQLDKDYVLIVNNVRDRSAAGNVIAANSSVQYRLAGDGNGNGTGNSGNLIVNSLSLGNYQVGNLRVGDTYYVDRTYRINHVPSAMRNALWIRTANADKANNQPNFLEFNLNREADVYIAYDSRATGVPSWLSRDFDKTNEYVGVSETVGRLDLWRGHFLPGRVRLGGNLASGAANVNSMYVVLIDDLQNPAASNSEVPRSFVLYQNYPNPFNPRTEIGYYVERESYVVINIYNSLGQIVRTLYEGNQAQGQHRLTWDARNDRGQLVPSGIYMYTLEVREQMSSNGVTLNSAVTRLSRSMTLLK